MSRRVNTGASRGTLQTGAESAEDFMGRLVKYVPTEIVGLYLAASGVMPPDIAASQTSILWFVFAACAILTPIYMFVVTRTAGRGPLWIQVMLATVAFPVWVFVIGGPFGTLDWYEGYIASLVLIFVTFAFGLIKPKAGS